MGMIDEIERDFLSGIMKLEYADSEYPFFIMTDFGSHFPMSMSCYEISDEIRAAGVVTRAVLEDHEHSCCYYNFKTRRSAESFCKRLAKFLTKKRGG